MRRILDTNPNGWDPEALRYAAHSANQVDRVWNAVRPALTLHGHLHVHGDATAGDGRQVIALSRDGGPGNVALLNLTDLSVRAVPHETFR